MTSRLTTVADLAAFLPSTKRFILTLETIEDTYHFIDRTIDRFRYKTLTRKEKHMVFLYVKKMTVYKKAQLLRLIKRAVLGASCSKGISKSQSLPHLHESGGETPGENR